MWWAKCLVVVWWMRYDLIFGEVDVKGGGGCKLARCVIYVEAQMRLDK
jgi:hypothetical protein